MHGLGHPVAIVNRCTEHFAPPCLPIPNPNNKEQKARSRTRDVLGFRRRVPAQAPAKSRADHHLQGGRSSRLLWKFSPTSRSCSNAVAATEEPRVGGQVHSSRESLVETDFGFITLRLINPRSGVQERRAIFTAVSPD